MKKIKFNREVGNGKSLSWKNYEKRKSVSIVITMLLIFSVIPIFSPNVIMATAGGGNAPVLDGLLDDVYITHGKKIHYGNLQYENASGDLYIIDNVTIDPDYVWLAWVINPGFVDNTYGSGIVGQYRNPRLKPCGHSFKDLVGSDMQEIRLYDCNHNLVFDAKMDTVERVASSPSGYGTPPWGDGESKIIYGDGSKVEYTTSTVWNVNHYYGMPGGIDPTKDSPPTNDDYEYSPPYDEWEHRIIYELRVDRSIFGGCSINAEDTEFPAMHASPNKIGPHSIPVYPYTCSIEGRVWHDLFHIAYIHEIDGIQDEGEPGIEGVIVELYDGCGNKINSTTTDSNGYYYFDNLPTGEYIVKISDTNFEEGGVLEGWYARF